MGKSDTKSLIKKNRGGRPTKYNKEVVKKLESILKVGGTIEEACAYAGISKETYYTWLDVKPGFLTKMEAAKHYADIVAKNVVVRAIVEDKDLATAKWWLEKRQFRDFNFNAIQINVSPILGGMSRTDDSHNCNQENRQSQKKD